jgi:hypothetical protein
MQLSTELVPCWRLGQFNMGANKGTGRAIVQIPLFQRPYEWGRDLVENLVLETLDHIDCETEPAERPDRAIKDFWAAKNDEHRARYVYFAGAVVVAVRRENSEVEWSIVDGQQRYTTVFLLSYLCHSILCLRLVTLSEAAADPVRWLNTRQNLESNLRNIYTQERLYAFSTYLQKLQDDLYPRDGKPRSQDASDRARIAKELAALSTTRPAKLPGRGRLVYDRESYNDDLAVALERIRLEGTGLVDVSWGDDDEWLKDATDQQKQFYNASKWLFEAVGKKADEVEYRKRISDGENNRGHAMVLICNGVLGALNLAVVSTEDPQYAYTLFEVLNGRHKPVEDFALVRNLFYRKYYKDNSPTPEVGNDLLVQLDKTWEDAFSDKTQTLRKLVLECGAYVIYTPQSPGKKSAHQARDYLQDFVRKIKLDQDAVTLAFATFRAINDLFQWARLSANSRPESMEETLKESSGTWLKRAFHLLHTLRQTQVFAALLSPVVAVLLRDQAYFMTENPQDRRAKVDGILGNPAFKLQLERLAYNTARLAIADVTKEGPTTSAPAALEWLRNNPIHQLTGAGNDKSHLPNRIDSRIKQTLDYVTHEDAIGKLRSWLRLWQYNDSKDRLVWLFTLVMLRGPNGMGAAIAGKGHLNFDHIEPLNPKKDMTKFDRERFFDVDDSERPRLVNSLGNMFPLDSGRNKTKSNQPAAAMFTELKRGKISNFKAHFLADMLEKQLNKYSKKLVIEGSSTTTNVPTRDFFEKRTETLCNIFVAFNAVPMDPATGDLDYSAYEQVLETEFGKLS